MLAILDNNILTAKNYAEQISQECLKSCAEGHCIADNLLSIHMLQVLLFSFVLTPDPKSTNAIFNQYDEWVMICLVKELCHMCVLYQLILLNTLSRLLKDF